MNSFIMVLFYVGILIVVGFLITKLSGGGG
jgi:hypothetical protein